VLSNISDIFISSVHGNQLEIVPTFSVCL